MIRSFTIIKDVLIALTSHLQRFKHSLRGIKGDLPNSWQNQGASYYYFFKLKYVQGVLVFQKGLANCVIGNEFQVTKIKQYLGLIFI